ncbi:HlyD family secretion protein [Enterobacteriaceae bacterium LUAb1]
MSQSLFRQEALDAQKERNRIMGTVSLYSPPYRWLIITLVSILAVLVSGFAILGSYTKKETASGNLLPGKGIYNITAPVSGTIARMMVKKGQAVRKDQMLMLVSSELSTAIGQTRQVIHEQLALQRSRLLAERDSINQLHTESMESWHNQSISLASQQVLLKTQQAKRQQQLTLMSRQLSKLQTMRDQGFASNRQVDEQQNNVLEAEARLQDTERLMMDLAQKQISVHQKLREQPLNLASQQNEIDRKMADVERSLAENEAHRAIYIQAPQVGTIGATLVKQGQVVNMGQPLLYMLPHQSKLQASIMVSSRAIGFINPGQPVMLRYEAYPYQKFGVQHGRVTEVSTAALSPQEVMAITGNSDVHERLFQVIVELDKQSINLYGKEVPLRSGIRLEADFLIEKRRIIEWVFEPLYALGHRL